MLAYKFSYLIRHTYLQAANLQEKGNSRGDPMVTALCWGTVSIMVQSWHVRGVGGSDQSGHPKQWHSAVWGLRKEESAERGPCGPQAGLHDSRAEDCADHVWVQATRGSPGSPRLDRLLEWDGCRHVCRQGVRPDHVQGRACRPPLWWFHPPPAPCPPCVHVLCTVSYQIFKGRLGLPRTPS